MTDVTRFPYARLPMTSREVLDVFGVASSPGNEARDARAIIRKHRINLLLLSNGLWVFGVAT